MARVHRRDAARVRRHGRRYSAAVPPGEPTEPTEPTEQFNLAQVFDTLAGAVPDRECLIWRDRRVTYGQVAERSRRLAAYLHGQGLGMRVERSQLAGHESGQDHVALALYNGNEYIESMLGGYRARVAPFNVNYRYVGEELRYLLNDARPRALILHASLAPTLADVLPTLHAPPDILLQVDDESGHDLLPGAVPYEEALAASSPDGPPVDPSPDDLYILYTGGTTGMPKGVLWRQHDIFIAAMGGRSVGTWEVVTSYQGIVERLEASFPLKLLLLPPLMHGAAQWAGFILLSLGATIIFPDNPRRVDPDDVWRTVERERANTMTVVGDAILRPLLMQLDKADYDLSSFFALGNGGAPLTPAVRALALERLPTLIISDSAGASETGAQMHAVSGDGGQVGAFLPGPGTVVIDEELRAVLPPEHEGNGWLAQTGHVPLGYLGDADKTARTFPVVDGVRYSIPGDRARHLADGQIELLGRDSVTVNSGGEKIFAEEVERAIAGHPAVADVVVTGRPSERWGQEVVAVVQLADGAETTPDSITQHASAFIARYKLPKAVIFVEVIQRSPSGKADYRWAAEQAVKG
jgi:acyl-CoA synthetase (AMP-forming)/AMP-acid ligase II